MARQLPNNFDPAHYFYSQALVTVSNPYSSAFSDVRNSTVSSLKSLDKAISGSQRDAVVNARSRLSEAKVQMSDICASASSIAELRSAIEGMMNKAPIEAHVDIFADQSDSSKEDEWDDIGSDEEVVC